MPRYSNDDYEKQNDAFKLLNDTSGSRLMLHVTDQERVRVLSECKCYTTSTTTGMYLPLPFETLDQYLKLLKLTSIKLSKFGSRLCFYLAAAVSDFYVPDEKVV